MSSNGHVTAAASGTFTLGGDMTVNRMGYGAMRITGDGIWGQPDDIPNAHTVLKRVLELEVNFIDTADSYGPDVSEELIAEALHPYADGVVIATKGGMMRSGPNQWHTNGRPQHLREVLEGSLKRLKQERIDLYQFHRPDPEVPFEDSVGEIAKMRDEGKIRHIGLSNVDTDQLAQALEMVPIVSVQNRYNINDRASEDVLKMCEQKGIAFIPWYPISAGSLSDAKMQEIAAKYDASLFQLALAWLLKHSPVMLPIPGTQSVSHLEENVAASTIDLSDDDYATLSALES